MMAGAAVARDRITSIHISGLRAIEKAEVMLQGLTVLIGDNGTGKSTVLEALEIMRLASQTVSHVPDLEKTHGAFTSLLRRGSDALELEVSVEGGGPGLLYGFSMGLVGATPRVIHEWLDEEDAGEEEPRRILHRRGGKSQFRTSQGEMSTMDLDETTLSVPYVKIQGAEGIKRLLAALEAIEVHVPFETRPLWQQKELDIRTGPRWPAVVERTDRLARFAVNLPNAFQRLRNQGGETWSRVIELARLGLGHDLQDIRLEPSGRGNIELEVLIGTSADKPLPAEVLSEGQLSYLAFIALCELHEGRSVLAFDEPEIHLHPALLARVVWMLEEVAKTAPVIVATHSDRFLDALEEPAKTAVLCELDERKNVTLRRPNPVRLAEWLEEYGGLGRLRAEGYEPHVFAADEGTGAKGS